MRLFLIVVLAGLLSFGVGLALVVAVNAWIPCHDTSSSCNMGMAMGHIAVMTYAPLAILVFGITAWFARSERALAIAALWLLAPVAAMLLYGVMLEGIPTDFSRELPDLLRCVLSPVLIVAVQWALLRAYMRRTAPV